MAMTKVKNLQLWCKRMAEGYRDVEVRDMAASWKSGLAFCAVIHRFRPDLIDYDSLSKENVFENNNMAFEVAEKELNIPAFLEAADMVAIRVPDKLSVVTYVSQYYNYFHDKPQLGGPGVNKFSTSGKKKDATPTAAKSLTPAKVESENTPKKDRQDTIGDKCMICHEKVYLLERHIESGKLYHRSCHRKSELSPTNKVFKRQPFTSPDDEKKDFVTTKQRKLDSNNTPLTSTPKSTEPQLDFWQRRNQARLKEKDEKVAMETTPSGNSNSATTELLSSKFSEDKNRTNQVKVPSVFETGSKDKKEESKPKGVNYADKFKELNDRNLKQLNDTLTSDNRTKSDESKSFHPKAKPRTNIASRFEKMDTSEKTVEPDPKPVSRFSKVADNLSPKASPRHLDNKSKPTGQSSAGFSRPKTPPQSHKSEFKLKLGTNSALRDDSPSSPPPLPSSEPPRLPASQPPKVVTSVSKQDRNITSPKSSPRNTNTNFGKKTSDKESEVKSPRVALRKSENITPRETTSKPELSAPSKPPRASAVIESMRSPSPMDTAEFHKPAVTNVKASYGSHDAVLVTPNRSSGEQKDKEVFGGLLKSLANVRTKYGNENSNKSDEKGATEVKSSDKTKPNDRNVLVPKDIQEPKIKQMTKISTDDDRRFQRVPLRKIEETEEPHPKIPERPKTSYVPDRPKSSFVSQNKFMEKEKSDPKGHVTKTTKTVTTTTTVTTKEGKTEKTKDIIKEMKYEEDDIPEWKRKLEERKKAKNRPKSADLLTEKSTNGEGLLEWQKEAAKRKELRKGGYEDPEKPKLKPVSAITPNAKTNDQININTATKGTDKSSHKPSRPETGPSKATVPSKVNVNQNNAGTNVQSPKVPERKKITFNGSVIDDDKDHDKERKKISVDVNFKFEEITVKQDPKKPPRPGAPPKGYEIGSLSPKLHPGKSPPQTIYQHVKHHMSPQQIQNKLAVIDKKLTQLELKGRELEDAIRTGKEEEEDDLMIAWFQLVNEKNELVRTECDYIYINREQELEIEQLSIDQRLQELVQTPEAEKSMEEREEEETLIDRKLEVVCQRNKIVDSIDEDRLRYLDEDSHIEAILQQKGLIKGHKDGKKVK